MNHPRLTMLLPFLMLFTAGLENGMSQYAMRNALFGTSMAHMAGNGFQLSGAAGQLTSGMQSDAEFILISGLNYRQKKPVNTGLADSDGVPASFSVHQNYPNPFNPTTVIPFQIPETGKVMIEVYDITGKRVARLADRLFEAGDHAITFNAASLASGIYILRINYNSISYTRKMLLQK